MSELAVTKYLRTEGLPGLERDFKIWVKRHPAYPHLVFLKYDQIDSPMASEVVQDCRGIILDESRDWTAVSFPFRKFFNYGEGHAAKLNWDRPTVYEKLDGSLMTLYFYDGSWRVASNGTPDAGGPVQGEGLTFGDLFWQTWTERGLSLPDQEDHCFMFELMTPLNRVVVPHSERKLALIGCRNLQTFGEVPPETVADRYGWPCVGTFPLSSCDDIVAAAAELNPMQSEGYVVRDEAFNRVKVKSPKYVALAHMKDGFSDRRMLELIRLNEGSEFLGYFPEFRPLYEKQLGRVTRLIDTLEGTYRRISGIESQKDFALEATKCPLSGVLFRVRSGQARSIREGIKEVPLPTLERALEVVA